MLPVALQLFGRTMLELSIPGFGDLVLCHLVLDFNGTIAAGGTLIPGMEQELNQLAATFKIHVVTGNSFGKAQTELSNVNCNLKILASEHQCKAKAEYITHLDPRCVVAIGNGCNDEEMLRLARVGIAVLGEDGLASKAALAANILVKDIFSALVLLQSPKKLMSVLRT